MTQPKAEFVISAVDRASAVMQKVDKSLNGLGERISSRWDGVGAALAKTAAGVYALKAGGESLFNFANGAVDAADKIGDLADITKAASKDIQVFGQLNEMAGGDMDSAAKAIARLQKAKQLAITTAGDERDAFRAAGISVEDLRKKKPAELLVQMADAFKVSENAGGKLLIAQKLLGKGSESMVSVLNQGGQVISDKYAEMAANGALLTERQLEIAGAGEKAFMGLKSTWGGLKAMAGLELAQALIPVVDAVKAWMVANRGLISQKMQVFLAHLPAIIDGVSSAFKVLWIVGGAVFKVFEMVGHVLGPDIMGWLIAFAVLIPLFASMIGVVGSLVGGLGTLLSAGVRIYRMLTMMATMMRVVWLMGRLWLPIFGRALVAALVRFATAGIGMLMTALRGLTVFLATNPFTIWLVAIAAAAALIYSNWDSIVAYVTGAWERIKAVFDAKGFFGALWQGVLEIFQGYLNMIIGLFKKIPGLGKLIPQDFQYSFAERNAGALTAGQVAKAQQQSFNGKLQVEILGDKKARVTEMKSDNTGMQMSARHGLSGAPA